MTAQRRRWRVFQDADELYRAATTALLARAAAALAERGCFRLVLPGGRTPLPLLRALRASGQSLAGWELYLSDERCLPAEHEERNSRLVERQLMAGLGGAAPRLHAIPAEQGPEAGARACCATLAAVDRFDVVLLGLGEDGHTASLFPGHDWGEGADAAAALAVRDAPKWPPERVSLGARRLAAARRVVFIACGAEKAPAIAAWHGGQRLPVAAPAPAGGVDILLADDCAAAIRHERVAGGGAVF